MSVLVIGNCTLDLLFNVPHLPRPGETLLAKGFMTDVGGKGANQAVAVARTGTPVRLVAAAGDDRDGETIRSRLAGEQIDLRHFVTFSGPTDQSHIYVAPDGENFIISTQSGAARLTPSQAAPALAELPSGGLLLMQGNLSLTTTEHCLAEARRHGARTLLNTAPINFDYGSLWNVTTGAILNEVELESLTGMTDPEAGGFRILQRGVAFVVATLGSRGAVLVTADDTYTVSAPDLAATDTTGAGDVFCGTFAAGLVMGLALQGAAELAVGAASLSVTRGGTQSSFPTREELQTLIGDLVRSGGRKHSRS